MKADSLLLEQPKVPINRQFLKLELHTIIVRFGISVRFVLEQGKNAESNTLTSEKIVSDPVAVTVTEEPLPWEGNGSEESPYIIKSASDLEALREKVNKDGFAFSDAYFKMDADITLPDGWKPIGATKDGR